MGADETVTVGTKVCSFSQDVLTVQDRVTGKVVVHQPLLSHRFINKLFQSPDRQTLLVLFHPTPDDLAGTQQFARLGLRLEQGEILFEWVIKVPMDAEIRTNETSIYVTIDQGLTYVLDNKTGNRIAIHWADWLFSFEGDTLVCLDRSTRATVFRKRLAHPDFETLQNLKIKELHVSPDRKGIIVLFHPPRRGYRTAGNLARVSLGGEIEWWSELTDTGIDAYVSVDVTKHGIWANSYEFWCQIDERTGTIVQRHWAK
ncbi:MAG: hypothetical protein NUW24_17030 [Anaerolineae bacterium]|jgi:hypothetical protein|nr:hypothetical protein [Anaerolineae bacterium]